MTIDKPTVPDKNCQQPPAQLLQVLRAVGDGQARLFRQRLHATLSLRELLEDHEPCRGGKGARDKRVFLQQGEFRAD